jgi:hypothetical protein
MAHKVLERVALPIQVEREVHKGVTAMVPSGDVTLKLPGETITAAEFKEHGQDADDIAALVKSGAIEEA